MAANRVSDFVAQNLGKENFLDVIPSNNHATGWIGVTCCVAPEWRTRPRRACRRRRHAVRHAPRQGTPSTIKRS